MVENYITMELWFTMGNLWYYGKKRWYYGKNYSTIQRNMELWFKTGKKHGRLPKTMTFDLW